MIGFCKIADIKLLKQGVVPPVNGWALVKPAMLKSLQRFGWGGKDNNHTSSRHKYMYKNTFAATKQGYGVLVRFDNFTCMVYDVNGDVLPVAIWCDYISASIDNYHYNLSKVVSILKKRNDISFVTNGVEPIPHYNNESGLDSYIGFYWQPYIKDYKQMWAKCKKIGGDYTSNNMYQAIFEEDLLGLRAGGAARFGNFYESQEQHGQNNS